ncbi:MAG: CBS domain-containing protein [Nitrospinales bacterium]
MLTARNIMSEDVVTIKKDASIDELAAMFIKHKVNGIPVVGDADEVIGIVTEGDLIEQNKNLHIPTVITLFDAVIFLESNKKFEAEMKKLAATKVGDICQFKVVTVSPDEPVARVAAIMADENIHTLPVVENGKLAGVIGKLDVIKAMSHN